MTLSPDTLLHRAAELDLGLAPNGEIEVYVDGVMPRRFGPMALGLIDVFTASKRLGDGITELTPRLPGQQAYADVIATVAELLEAGVLRAGSRPAQISEKPYPFGWYDSPGIQIRILRDRRRRQAFLDAVAATVRPGDTVLDLGTGNGILAVAAARAGARKVYAVEPSNVAAFAREVIRRNGVDDCVEVIEGWSQHIELPERADVLTLDLIGSEPLQMGVLEIVRDAAVRHLRRDARIVPARVRFAIALVEVPAAVADAYMFSEPKLAEWSAWYGIDFSALAALPLPTPVPAYVEPSEAARYGRLSKPEAAWDVELGREREAPLQGACELTTTRAGRCNGLLGITTLALGDDVRFVADPLEAGDAPHWLTPLWLLPVPVDLTAGESVRARYDYHGQGRAEVRLT